jgi:hypothetical protein
MTSKKINDYIDENEKLFSENSCIKKELKNKDFDIEKLNKKIVENE